VVEHSIETTIEKLTSLTRGLLTFQFQSHLPSEVEKTLSFHFAPQVRRILEEGPRTAPGAQAPSAEIAVYKSLHEKASTEAADWARKYDAVWAQKLDLEYQLEHHRSRNSSASFSATNAAELAKLSDKVADLEQQVAVLARQENVQRELIGDLKRRLAEKTRSETALRSEVSALRDGAQLPTDEKFKSAKREFAKRYHPESDRTTGFEKRIRTDIFKQFWPILEDIEKKPIPL
jgi:predicted  nucleic acid-binding Zn-ribbon protein